MPVQIQLDMEMASPVSTPSPSHNHPHTHTHTHATRSHGRSQSWCAATATASLPATDQVLQDRDDDDDTAYRIAGPQRPDGKDVSMSPVLLCPQESFDVVKTPLRRVPKRHPVTRGKKRQMDDRGNARSKSSPEPSYRHSPSQDISLPHSRPRSPRSRSKSRSVSPRQGSSCPKSVEHAEAPDHSSMSLDSDMLSTPAPPSTEIKRLIAPLRSSRSSLFVTSTASFGNNPLTGFGAGVGGTGTAPSPSPIQPYAYAYREKAPSRESSPVHGQRNDSSPLKKPRTSLNGDIINFHYSSDSDSESDTPSPTMRTRARFNQLLGPSPLQKSFSSSTSPPTPCGTLQKSISTSSIPSRPSRTPLSLPLGQPPHMTLPGRGSTDTGMPSRSERSISSPLLSKTAGYDPEGNVMPSEMLSPLKARSKILSEVEGLGTELDKVFALVHGKGLGMSAGGGRTRRPGSSGLRNIKSVEVRDPREKEHPGPVKGGRSRSQDGRGRDTGNEMQLDPES